MGNIRKYKYFKSYIKVEKIIKFSGIEIQNQIFHRHKEPISIKDVDFGKKGFNCFIGNKDVKN